MNKRKMYLIAGGIGILVAAGLFIAKTRYESNLRGNIEAFLANLPPPLTASAEKIDVSIFDKSVALTNLKGQFKDGANELEFSIARVEAKGLNLAAFKPGAGTMNLADSMTFINSVAKGPGVYVGIENQTMENVSGDFSMLMDEYLKALPELISLYKAPGFEQDEKARRKAAGALSGVLKAYETISIGKFTLRNYTYTVLQDNKKIAASLANAEGRNYSIREMGPFSMTGMMVAMDEKPVMSWESLSCDGMILPSLVELLKALGSDFLPSREMLKATLEGQPFAMKNLRGKKLEFRDPENPDRKIFALDDFVLSYEAGDSHSIDSSYSGFTVDKRMIRDEGDLPDAALALLPDVLSFEGALQGSATRKNPDTIDVDGKKLHLKEASLGEALLSFSVKDLNILAVILGMPGPSTLEGLDLSVTDAGASELLFIAVAKEEDDTPANVRAEMIKQFAANRESLPNDTLKGLADAMAKFLKKPGKTLAITLAPEKPVPLMLLQSAAFTDPAALGLTFSVTPNN